MSLQITSDGTPQGTVVTFNGEKIPNVISVKWYVSAGELVTAEIVFFDVHLKSKVTIGGD